MAGGNKKCEAKTIRRLRSQVPPIQTYVLLFPEDQPIPNHDIKQGTIRIRNPPLPFLRVTRHFLKESERPMAYLLVTKSLCRQSLSLLLIQS